VKTVPGEFYAGHKAGETPRFALVESRRLEVREVLERKRTLDPGTGKVTDVFRCRLEDGRVVDVAIGVAAPTTSTAV
jgi:hypothetical protein